MFLESCKSLASGITASSLDRTAGRPFPCLHHEIDHFCPRTFRSSGRPPPETPHFLLSFWISIDLSRDASSSPAWIAQGELVCFPLGS
jgi:hypothetical protein